MANISDQLAADIHNAFNKYYTDLANQDQFFFGVGDVTITKQDGTTATVRSWNKVIGIELMYETGGWNRLLTAQGEMNVDNMSFVVPAGSGDAVLRYGCYLDRNGQMVLTILSRFDAFSARNNNVIRGSSTP
ncbi:TPA: hypothetical protein ACQZKF_001865 [Klebsiella pneumoniae]